MTAYYTLNETTRLSVFLWEDYLHGDTCWHTPVEVTEIDMTSNDGYTYKLIPSLKYPGEKEGLTHKLKVHEDLNGRRYFIYKDTPVYFDSYDYHDISVLVEEIEMGKKMKDNWFVRDDMILASMSKQPDGWGILVQPRRLSFRFPGTSIGLCGEPEGEPILYIPKLEPLREIKDWHYKIKFHAADEEERYVCGTEDYYFHDLCSLIKSGCITMVAR